jgi:sialic acid synthase SpsE
LKINVIAEIGSNWEGDIELGKLHIKKSKEAGATYVKFQMWHAEDIYEKSDPNWKLNKKSELTEDIAIELKKYADKIGIKWFCSVFYPEAVDFLEELNVPIYKIASWTTALKHKFALETMKAVAETRKLTFVSTGYGVNKTNLKNIFKNSCKFTYCISEYPTSDNMIKWNELRKYNFFSDHTLGITVPLTYAILKKEAGAKEIFIEKHVKLDESKGQDAAHSITFDELTELIKHTNRITMFDLS